MTSKNPRINVSKTVLPINLYNKVANTPIPFARNSSPVTTGRRRNSSSAEAGPGVRAGAVVISHYRGQLLYNGAAASGISVITPTNKPHYMEQVFANYLRQTYEPKELIIVLNNNSMNLNEWQSRASQYPNIRVFQLDENLTLGECMNFAIEQSASNYIAIVDDDDYYASAFLQRAVSIFSQVSTEVVGKASYYVYFEASKTLAIANPSWQNQYNHEVAGATMVFKKEVWDKVKFPPLNNGPDTRFSEACIQNGIRIYSGPSADFVYIRRTDPTSHTWQIEERELLRNCTVLCQTEDYITPTTLY